MRTVKDELGEFLNKEIGREPMIVPMYVYITRDPKSPVPNEEGLPIEGQEEKVNEIKKEATVEVVTKKEVVRQVVKTPTQAVVVAVAPTQEGEVIEVENKEGE
jgi:hypothetical protein